MKAFQEYREKYGSVRNVRQAFYSKESFNCVIQRQLSKDDDACKILSYHKKIHSLFSLLEKHQQILQTVITIFDDEDATVIRKNYNENVHLRNIKDNAILAHVKWLPTTLEFVIHGDFNTDYNIINEKKEKEAIKQIIDGENKLTKV